MSLKKDATLTKSIANNIREYRKKKFPGHGGQTLCAKKFDIEVSTWNQLERGTRLPSDMYQRKLADFFGVTVSELRGDNPASFRTAADGEHTALVVEMCRLSGRVQLARQLSQMELVQGKLTGDQFEEMLLAAAQAVSAVRKKYQLEALDLELG
mgnify:CR=1 FL=1